MKEYTVVNLAIINRLAITVDSHQVAALANFRKRKVEQVTNSLKAVLSLVNRWGPASYWNTASVCRTELNNSKLIWGH